MKKKSIVKLVKTPQTPAFQIAIRKRGVNHQLAATTPKPKKRENTFSKSRDTREDRGTREMKTMHNSQTLPHGR